MSKHHNEARWWWNYGLGGFAKNGGRLHKVTGKINADHYKSILKYCVLPSMQNLFGDGEAILQQDNATCHVANSVKSREQNKTCKFFLGLETDLNPIEHIWDYVTGTSKTPTNCRKEFKPGGMLYHWNT